MKKKKNIFWGILLIAVAVFLLVNQLGFLSETIGVWSIILGVFFVGCGVDALIERNAGGVIFSLAFLLMIFGKTLGLPAMSPWVILVIAGLLSMGISMIFPHKHKPHVNHDENWTAYEDPNQTGEYQTVVDEEKDEVIYCSNRLGATSKYINTANFKKAVLECSLGEMKVFFDQAKIVEGRAEVEVHLSMGHMEFYIPKEWNVIQNANVSLASVDEKNHAQTNGQPILNLVGDVSLGELTIIYV